MENRKRDLVIHYDEENQKVIIYSTDAVNTEAIRAKEFDGVCPDVERFKSQEAGAAEQDIGGIVFALLDSHSNKKIGIRNYKAVAEENFKQWIQVLEEQVKNNDPDAQFNLFIQLHNQAIENCSINDLSRAESLLLASAAQGHAEAKSSLELWEVMKATAIRRIDRVK
jgi:hypothetical protein